MRNPFSIAQWIAWIGATLTAAVSMSAYVYGEFETKERAHEFRSDITYRLEQQKEDITKRLDRIEDKVDQLLSRSR